MKADEYKYNEVPLEDEYHSFLWPISKNFLAIKDINKPFLHAKFKINWFESGVYGVI